MKKLELNKKTITVLDKEDKQLLKGGDSSAGCAAATTVANPNPKPDPDTIKDQWPFKTVMTCPIGF